MLDRLRALFFPGVVVVLVAAAVSLLVSLATRSPAEPRDEPARVTRTYFAEKDGANPTGRICSQVLAQTGSGVAVGLSCAYPPAESRLADLLEGAGQ